MTKIESLVKILELLERLINDNPPAAPMAGLGEEVRVALAKHPKKHKKYKSAGKVKKVKKVKLPPGIHSYVCLSCHHRFNSRVEKMDAVCPECNSFEIEDDPGDIGAPAPKKVHGLRPRWTAEDEERLMKMDSDGVDEIIIAKEFGKSVGAIKNKLMHLKK
jgi:predicted Zn-ribbon and HTH transcriptional regulator